LKHFLAHCVYRKQNIVLIILSEISFETKNHRRLKKISFFDTRNFMNACKGWLKDRVYSQNVQVQEALVICGLFICDFAYMRSRNDLFSGTYPLIISHTWSFYMRIHYMWVYFWSPYLSHITRSNCTAKSQHNVISPWLNCSLLEFRSLRANLGAIQVIRDIFLPSLNSDM